MRRSKAEVLAEIQKLIDEQMEASKDTLTNEQSIDLAERWKKIDQLLEEISRNGAGK